MSIESTSIIINSIRACVPKPLQHVDINSTSLLQDLGIDSLGLMMLTLELEKNTGVKLNAHVESLVQAQTVRDIEKLVSSLQPAVESAQ